MTRMRRWHMLLGLFVAALVWPHSFDGQTAAPPAGEWRAYGNDEKKHALLAARPDHSRQRQEPAGRLDLEVRQLRHAAETVTTETTPIMVNGVLYFTAGQRRTVVAANAATGETLWTWRPNEGARFDRAPRKIHRGVAYWTDGRDGRIVVVTPGYQLVSLDAKTGAAESAASARTASSICSSSSMTSGSPT